jgi:hypothetical protein
VLRNRNKCGGSGPGFETSVESQGQVPGLENELQWQEVVLGETQSLTTELTRSLRPASG